jgi:hypothetical protein
MRMARLAAEWAAWAEWTCNFRHCRCAPWCSPSVRSQTFDTEAGQG